MIRSGAPASGQPAASPGRAALSSASGQPLSQDGPDRLRRQGVQGASGSRASGAWGPDQVLAHAARGPSRRASRGPCVPGSIGPGPCQSGARSRLPCVGPRLTDEIRPSTGPPRSQSVPSQSPRCQDQPPGALERSSRRRRPGEELHRDASLAPPPWRALGRSRRAQAGEGENPCMSPSPRWLSLRRHASADPRAADAARDHQEGDPAAADPTPWVHRASRLRLGDLWLDAGTDIADRSAAGALWPRTLGPSASSPRRRRGDHPDRLGPELPADPIDRIIGPAFVADLTPAGMPELLDLTVSGVPPCGSRRGPLVRLGHRGLLSLGRTHPWSQSCSCSS